MGGAFGQPGPESGAQVCRLPAQERTQVTSGTKQWGLRDCRSLAASWPAWVLGFPPQQGGDCSSRVCPRAVLALSLVLGLLREIKGCPNFRQCNLSKIKLGEKR